MDLLKGYNDYVKWCKATEANPIGFVNWKGKKLGMSFNTKTGVWTKNTKP